MIFKKAPGSANGNVRHARMAALTIRRRFYIMSVLNLKKYGELCAKDTDVRKKAKEIGIEDLDGQIAHAKSLGLEISREDFVALAKEAGLEGKNELSEEDLKKVAGGVFTVTAAALVTLAGLVGLAAGLQNKPGW
jgi:predicted ribosomally synthesized peptide with nif11-like leader